MGGEIEAEVSVSTPGAVMIASSNYLLRNRALTRARAIELDFTNGGDEEEGTMCPVCHESTPLPRLYSLAFWTRVDLQPLSL